MKTMMNVFVMMNFQYLYHRHHHHHHFQKHVEQIPMRFVEVDLTEIILHVVCFRHRMF